MFHSLRYKILLPLVMLTTSIAVLGSVVLYNYFSQSLTHELQLRTEGLADALRRSIEITSSDQYMRRIINAFGDSEGLELILLTTGDPPEIIAATKHMYVGSSSVEANEQVEASEIGLVDQTKKSVFKYLPHVQVFIATIPIQLHPPAGEIRPRPAVLSLHLNSADTRNAVIRTGAIWVVALIALLSMMAVTTYILLNKIIISPLTYLRKVTRLRAQGDSYLRVSVTSDDELGELSVDINSMLDEIQQEEDRKNEIMQKLWDSEERLSMALNATEDGLWDVNISTGELVVNANWYAMLGYDGPGKFTNLDSWFALAHENDKSRLIESWQRHINDEDDRLEVEYRIKTKYGEWLWVQVRGKIVEYNSHGIPQRIVGTQSDISERKHLDTVKSQFISVVSHELRTPLTSLKGSLSLVRGMHSDNLDEESLGLIDLADRNSQRLIDLVNDILDLSKLESDEFTCDLESVDIVALVKDCVDMNEGYGVNFSVELVFESEVDEWYIQVDKQRLVQAVSNLISNAIKFSDKKSEVKVNIALKNAYLRITVQDYGEGIPLKAQGSIFDKFVQADTTDTRRVGGTGLGLSITKHIIEHHNGKISFESTPGKGTSFYIDLPSASDDQERVLVNM